MKSSFKVAFATSEPPLPFGRDTAARTVFPLIQELAARGVPIRCLTLASRPEDVGQAQSLLQRMDVPLSWYPGAKRSWFVRQWQGWLRPLAGPIPEAFRRNAARLLEEKGTLLHVELIPMGWVAVGHPRAILNVQHLQLIDHQGFRTGSFRLWKSIRQSWRAEQKVLKRYRWIRVTSPRLAEAVKALNPKATVAVVPIALDLARYPFLEPAPSRPVVGLLGTMGWLPTRSAALRLIHRVWPRIKQQVPEAQLLLGGWAARRWLEPHVANRSDVALLENVPDAKDFFEQLAVMAYPTPLGSGMKVKVMEAMAYGAPVVTTTDGAEGLAIRSGREAFVTDQDEGFADAVVELLKRPDHREQMRRAARRFLEEEHSPCAVVDRLVDLYERVNAS